MSHATIVPHRVVNIATWSCDTCRKRLADCACPTGVECTECELSPEDAVFVGPRCEHSDHGTHRWRDDQGDAVLERIVTESEAVR